MAVLEDFVKGCSNVSTLAEGGQKKVYSADHPEWGAVVVKYGSYRYATSLERMTREVELLKELTSEFYPKHFNFLIDPVDRTFLIVEERLNAEELTTAKVRLSTDSEILAFLQQLIIALDEIWTRRIVHRDLKPANILVTPANEPRIIDLGIARFLDDISLTANVAPAGPATPMYSSPEQLLNKKSVIGPRTDFFLLGTIISELMLGFHPFDPTHVGNSNSLVENILSCQYVLPDEKRDRRLVDFVKGVLHAQPYMRLRKSDDVKGLLGI